MRQNPFLSIYNQIVYSNYHTQIQKREFVLAWKRAFRYGIDFTAGDWLTVLPVDFYTHKGENV